MNHFTPASKSNFFDLDLSGAYIRHVKLDETDLTDADLTGADCRGASFKNANFLRTKLARTNLTGADLTGAVNLTVDQLQAAIFDDSTRLPDYLAGAGMQSS